MKIAPMRKIVVPLIALSFGFAVPAFAQVNSEPTASQSMNAAGESISHAGSNTAQAAKDAYQGTATAVSDTKITTAVKLALHDDKTTKDSTISVSTSAGVVTLRGRVASDDVAAEAKRLATNEEGVRAVDNRLTISTRAMSD